jgi:gamma-glutamyl-gamma-aminobutyrate hydrolase PuuD
VQFHPEWQYSEDVFYAALFRAFGDAIRERRTVCK